MSEAAVIGAAQVDGRRALDAGRRRLRPPEPKHYRLGAPSLEHPHPPAHRRVRQVVDKIGELHGGHIPLAAVGRPGRKTLELANGAGTGRMLLGQKRSPFAVHQVRAAAAAATTAARQSGAKAISGWPLNLPVPVTIGPTRSAFL